MVFISSGEIHRGNGFCIRPVHLNKRSTLVVLFSTSRDVWAGAGVCQVWRCMVGNIQHACTKTVAPPSHSPLLSDAQTIACTNMGTRWVVRRVR